VVWTHGFGSSSHMFAGTAAALSDDHTVVTWDLPGHGRSVVADRPEEFTPERAIGHLVDLLDAAGAERAVLGGHSLGGYLSLRVALEHPDRVAGLILVGTGPGFRKDDGRAQWNEMCEGFARNLDSSGLAGLAGSPELRDGIHVGGATGLALAARHLLPQRDGRVIDGLGMIEVPALVVVGDRDRQFLASSSYLASKLAGAGGEPVVVADCGHAPPISQPVAFVDAVRTFLRVNDL
jgi:pimeloyl-ACP methyl ester carboxylesterase